MTFLSIEAILIFWKHGAFTAIRNNQPYRYFLFAANRLKMQKFKPRIDLKKMKKNLQVEKSEMSLCSL